MSRLLKDCPQQHSLPGVLPYDQIEDLKDCPQQHSLPGVLPYDQIEDSIWSYGRTPGMVEHLVSCVVVDNLSGA